MLLYLLIEDQWMLVLVTQDVIDLVIFTVPCTVWY